MVLILVLVVATILLAAPSQAGAQSFEHPTVLSDTTAQIAPRLQGGDVQLGILSEGVWHDPSQTAISISNAAFGQVPDDPAWAFLGEPGHFVVRTTGAVEPRPAGLPRLGVNTTLLPEDVALTLRNADGRNDVFLYEDDADGTPGARWFNSADGLPDARTVPPGTDARLGAAFTWSGLYCLDVAASTTLESGETVHDREWLTIVIGEEPETVRPCGAPGGVRLFDHGHLDIAPVLQPDDTLELKVHAEGFTELDDSVFHARPATQFTVPEDADHFSFRLLGPTGATMWNFPISLEDQFEQLWPGFNLHSAQDSALQRQLMWRLDGIASPDGSPAPGDVILWFGESELMGEPAIFSSRTGLPGHYALGSSASGHFHMNWTFTHQGVYCLNMAVTGRSAAGTPLDDSGVLTVAVGAIDPTTVTPCGRTGTPPPVATRPAVPDAPAGGTPVVAPRGHFDLAPELRDGALHVPVHETDRFGEGPGIDRDLGDVVLYSRQARERGFAGMPWLGAEDAPAFGLDAGGGLHQPALGWDTTRIAPGQLRGDLQWRLIGVTGPGTFGLHDPRPRSPERAIFGTVPGHEQQAWDLWPGTRTREGHWVFSQPGVYCVELEWAGTLASGEPVSRRDAVTIVADVAAMRFDRDRGEWVDVPPTLDPATVTPCETAEPPAGGAPPSPPGGQPAPPRTAPKSTRVTLRRAAVRNGTLRVACRLDAPGRCTVRAWLTRGQARRLGLRRGTIGRGAARLAQAGERTVKVRLSRRARRALRRVRRARIQVTATAGGSSATRTVVVRRR